MQAQARALVAISAMSLLFLTAVATRAFAGIELDNDVVIDWGNCNNPGCAGSARVVGAPRLVTEAGRVGSHLKIKLEANRDGEKIEAFREFGLELVARRATVDCLEDDTARCVQSFGLERSDPLTVDFNPESITLSGDVIITLQGIIKEGATEFSLTVNLSGVGHEVIVNRVGDVGIRPGGALDLPTRSIQLVRALNQIDSALLPRRELAELDARVPRDAEIAVGFTHAFDAAPDGNGAVHGGLLTIRIRRERRDFSSDFLLLDRGVRDLASGRPRIPLIFLRHLHANPVEDQPDTYDFDINLADVRISFLSAGTPNLSPPEWDDVTKDLLDGRLNVILVGKGTVDVSDLKVTFEDPPDTSTP